MGTLTKLREDEEYLVACPECDETDFSIIVDRPGYDWCILGIQCLNCGFRIDLEE